jgi:transmembrane sensor
VFDRDTIASVAAEFNRYNRIQIKVDDPRVAAMPISGVFHTYDIESFADFLNGLHGVHAAMLNQQLLVSSRAAASSAD